MKTISFFLCLLAVFVARAQTGPIEIGRMEKMRSGILNEDRSIWIHVPKASNNNVAPERYPVVYLLDGDANFPAVEAMLQQLGDGTVFPKMILVGIPNTNRLRDLTPSRPASSGRRPGRPGSAPL